MERFFSVSGIKTHTLNFIIQVEGFVLYIYIVCVYTYILIEDLKWYGPILLDELMKVTLWWRQVFLVFAYQNGVFLHGLDGFFYLFPNSCMHVIRITSYTYSEPATCCPCYVYVPFWFLVGKYSICTATLINTRVHRYKRSWKY